MVDLRQRLGQQGFLYKAGHAQFLLHAFTCERLLPLLAHELGHAHRRGGLHCQVVEHAPVVACIFLVAQARSQVDQPDQFAL